LYFIAYLAVAVRRPTAVAFMVDIICRYRFSL